MNHYMIDIETLDNKPTAIILSIAAAKFNFKDDEIENTYYSNVNIDSCKHYGMTAGKDTIDWWYKQPKEVFEQMKNNQQDIKKVLVDMSEFIGSGKKFLWVNGASFDYPILTNAYNLVGINKPWHYSAENDVRTVFNMFGYDWRSFKRVGNYHNALDDCITQIAALKDCLKQNLG